MKMAGSFSVGRVSYQHDVRLSHTKNVTEELSKDNIVIEDHLARFMTDCKTQDEAIKKCINEIMQPYVDEYNQGKKPSRQIKEPYCDYWASNAKLNKGKLCYEAVMQVGEHETNGKWYYQAKGESRESQKKVYEQMYRKGLADFKEKFPHLQVLYAVLHLDEENGTPHLHICYVPIGELYKQGVSHNVSIGNALASDGILRAENREEPFQLKRAYEKIHHEIVNPLITTYFKDAEIKEEIHGLEHQAPRTWINGKEQSNFAKLNEQKQELADNSMQIAELQAELQALAMSVKEVRWQEKEALQSLEELEEVKNSATETLTELKANISSLDKEMALKTAEMASYKNVFENYYTNYLKPLADALTRVTKSGMFIDDDAKRENTYRQAEAGANLLKKTIETMSKGGKLNFDLDSDEIAHITAEIEDGFER